MSVSIAVMEKIYILHFFAENRSFLKHTIPSARSFKLKAFIETFSYDHVNVPVFGLFSEQ